ncbi:MAG: hypothetical protein SFX72_00270 [Isosphaeraceae bacterium]|nr:hypothetical protein [Isosphaeraceae bacterium]
MALLVLAIIPWLGPLFRSVELPGGFKVEFRELEQAAKRIEASGLAASATATSIGRAVSYAFESVADADPNLALAGLRIEIESKLKKVAEKNGVETQAGGIRNVMRGLRNAQILTDAECSAINELLPLLNQAAHGATVDPTASAWALDFGPRVLKGLEERIGDQTVPRLIAEWKRRDGAMWVEVGTQLSKKFVANPVELIRELRRSPDDLFAWVDSLQQNTFTMFEAESEVDVELYQAYYIKFLDLMKNAAESLFGTDCDQEGRRIRNALDSIRVEPIR